MINIKQEILLRCTVYIMKITLRDDLEDILLLKNVSINFNIDLLTPW